MPPRNINVDATGRSARCSTFVARWAPTDPLPSRGCRSGRAASPRRSGAAARRRAGACAARRSPPPTASSPSTTEHTSHASWRCRPGGPPPGAIRTSTTATQPPVAAAGTRTTTSSPPTTSTSSDTSAHLISTGSLSSCSGIVAAVPPSRLPRTSAREQPENLAILLREPFRAGTELLHQRLAERGHAAVRPPHGAVAPVPRRRRHAVSELARPPTSRSSRWPSCRPPRAPRLRRARPGPR